MVFSASGKHVAAFLDSDWAQFTPSSRGIGIVVLQGKALTCARCSSVSRSGQLCPWRRRFILANLRFSTSRGVKRHRPRVPTIGFWRVGTFRSVLGHAVVPKHHVQSPSQLLALLFLERSPLHHFVNISLSVECAFPGCEKEWE